MAARSCPKSYYLLPLVLTVVAIPTTNSNLTVLYKNRACFVDMDVGLLVVNSTSSSNMSAPLATKMYHSQGNYRLQFELGQLYRESCAEQSHNYASNTSPNSSQVNGLIPCDHSALHGSDNSVTHVSPNKFKPRTKHLDQLPANTSELCSGIPHQLSASGSSRLQASKSQRTDTRVSAVRNESARSRSKKAVVLSSKNTGKKKT
uniref:Uncharacterized protein n=1 Tax=Avena sativa TaxID=4498 RepID=A0ACD5YK30_AVESA